jgi:TP901 family phage tail tape measure protein
VQGETIDINFKADIFQQIKELKAQFGQLNGKVSDIESTSKKSFGSITQSLKAINFVSVTQGIQNLNNGLKDLNAPGLSFQSQLAEVSAITGVVGDQLESLGKRARSSAKEFGGSATDSMNTYKTILSRLGPDIAKDEQALADMERNVRVLSKTMGGDAVASVDALTTAMLQYGVDLSDPAQAQKEMASMMNVMAAGAKEGAAEVSSISQGLKVSGVTAKQAKVSFEETNSALQALAKGGRVGAEAGTSLRNVLGKMAGEDIIPEKAREKLHALGVNMSIVSDKSIPFTERLRELKKAQADATLIAQVFGVENAAAAHILLDSIDAQEELTKKITDTNVAQEQADVIMATTEERLNRVKAAVDDAKISFFEATGGVTAYLEPVSQLAMTFSSFAPLAMGSVKVLKSLTKTKLATAAATKVTTAAQWLWNAAMMANPIVALITGVAVLGTGLYALSKAFDKTTVSEKLNAQIKQRVIDKTIDERVELTLLFDKLKKSKVGTDEYKDALSELNRKYPDILDKYDLHKGKIEDIEKAEQDLINTIKTRARQEATMELYTESLKREIELEEKYKETAKSGTIAQTLSSLGVWQTGQDQAWSDLYDERQKLKKLEEKIDLFPKEEPKEIVEGEETTNEGKGKSLVTPTGTGDPKEYSGAGGTIKNINIRIENLVKDITVSTTNLKQGLGQVKQEITEAFISAVRDVEVSL